MTFEEALNQALALLQRQGRVSYRVLKCQFSLDDAYLEDLDSTRRLVDGAVRLEALLPTQVKRKTEPVTLSKVLGTRPPRSPMASRGEERVLSQFVGRERELATLPSSTSSAPTAGSLRLMVLRPSPNRHAAAWPAC